MKITDMIALADANGKTYECKYGTYNSKNGFKFNYKIPADEFEGFVSVLVHDDIWKLSVEKKAMTKAEIEKALGYPIDIVYEKKETKPKDVVSNYYDEVEEMLNFLGLNSKGGKKNA